MELYIVRHGESRSQTGEDRGPDPELSQKGLFQAEKLGERLADIEFDYIYASHLSRAIQTAAGVARHQKSKPVIEIVPELAECGTDPFWNADTEKQKAFYSDLKYDRTCIGKSYESEHKRAEAALLRCVYPIAYENGFTSEEDSNEGVIRNNDKKVLIAAHGMYDAYLLSQLIHIPFDKNIVIEQKNTCINHLSLYTVNNVRRVTFLAFNDYKHIRNL